MAGKSDIKAGGAYVEVFVKGFRTAQQQLTAVGAGVTKLGAGIAAVGAAIVGPIAAAVQHFTAAGDALGKMSARTGVSASALAELGFAAEQGGATIEDVEKGIRKMQMTLGDAAQGTKTAVDALRQVGLSFDQISGMKPEDQFQAIAEGLNGISDPTMRAATAMDIFGRSGTMLLPMLSTLREVREEARQRGLIPTDEAVRDSEELNDAFNRVRRTGLSAFFEIGAAVAPMLLPALEAVSNITTGVIRWIRENQQLVRTVALIGVGLLAAGTAIAAIGGGIVAAGMVVGSIATILPVIATAAAAVLSPVGLIVAGVVAIGAGLAAAVVWWVKFTAAGRGAFAALMAVLRPFLETFRVAFSGIVNALRAGQIEIAFEIMTTALKRLWLQFIQFASGKFLELVKIVADNPLVRQILGDELAGRMVKFARGLDAAIAAEILALGKRLADLEAKAKAAAARAGVPLGAGGKFPGIEGLEAAGAARPSVTAGTTAAAVALTFGQRRPGELTREMLEELRFIRRQSIKAHRELLREFRGFAPRVGR